MLVHSYLYYEMNVNIVSDAKWSQWAMELVQLQKEHPQEANQVEFADLFQDWDGSSGAFLRYDDSIVAIAERLYEHTQLHKQYIKPTPAKPAVKPQKIRRGGLF